MPNWKKIALSGSSPEFAALTVDTSIQAQSVTGSFTGTFAGVISSSAQIASDISGSFASASGSIASDIAALSSFSSSLETVQYSYTGSFSGDGSGLTGVETQVTEQATITDDFSNVVSKTVTHNFNTKNVLVSVYTTNDELILPSTVITTDVNTVDVTFDSTSSGRVVVAKGGHIVSGTAELYTYRENLTGSDNYTITHSLDELYPVVQVYDTASNKQVIPGEIETLNTNSVKVTFDNTFSGLIVVKK
jgi:hypothetical protein